jgi:hypothetical protein
MFDGAASVKIGENVGPLAFARFALAVRRLGGTNGLTCGVPITDAAVNAVHWDVTRASEMFRLIRADRSEEIDGEICRRTGIFSS